MGKSDSYKRVYFLGAGASKASDFELPTMNEFFREEDFASEEYQNLHDFINKVFPKANISDLNLEDVITRLELSVDKFGAFGEHPETYLYDARREFDKYVRERLKINEHSWCPKHKILFKQLSKPENRDSIITLNYDLIIDHTLFKILKNAQGRLEDDCLLKRMYGLLSRHYLSFVERPSLPHDFIGLGHYLKLHGSIGWLYCKNSTCGNHQLFFPNWIDGGPSLHNYPGDLCKFCGSPLVSVIIPPTMNKTFNEYPKLGLLWSLAFREIRDAEELVLIGMSLPESDYYLKWLLNSAISSRDKKDKPLEVVAVNKIVDKEGKEDKKKVNCYKNKIKYLTGVLPEYWHDFCEYVENLKIEQA